MSLFCFQYLALTIFMHFSVFCWIGFTKEVFFLETIYFFQKWKLTKKAWVDLSESCIMNWSLLVWQSLWNDLFHQIQYVTVLYILLFWLVVSQNAWWHGKHSLYNRHNSECWSNVSCPGNVYHDTKCYSEHSL